MNKSAATIPGFPDRLVTPDETSLFEFARTLRLNVRARWKDQQSRGVAFAEIVIHVRQMIRDSGLPRDRFPTVD